jgi:pimeloyl-ACP methyl ester carboxylesterase
LSGSTPLDPHVLPAGVRSRIVGGVNGLDMHVLEAGFESPGRPCILLLHGFPELAYSWRKVLAPLAADGFHVIAPDQRGYGRTTGWDGDYDGDLGSFRLLNLVRDAIGLVSAFGYRSVAAVVGHDFGSPVAAWCALVRPDVFRSVVLMSAPFAGPPALAFDTVDKPPGPTSRRATSIDAELAALVPPRKHYQTYYCTPEANQDMLNAPQGLHAFLRAYYHFKSADWLGNRPFPLAAASGAELAKLPTYYVMRREQDMAETVAAEAPTAAQIAACRWLTDDDLAVYAAEFARTGFQGALQWYRCQSPAAYVAEMQTWSGLTVDPPSCFIAGANDWGVRQTPGALERMRTDACTDMRGVHLIDGAGHWVQQERPDEVVRGLVEFLHDARRPAVPWRRSPRLC